MKDVNAAGRIENWTSKSVAYVRSDYLDFDNVLWPLDKYNEYRNGYLCEEHIVFMLL